MSQLRQNISAGTATRASALWGRRGGERCAVLAAAAASALLTVGPAVGASHDADIPAAVPASLLQRAQANPGQSFNVIVQGDRDSSRVADDVRSEHGNPRREFTSIAGAAATLTGSDLLKLAHDSHVLAITPDLRLTLAGYQDATMWPQSVDLGNLNWNSWTNSGTLPSVAIVDSGVQDRKEFGRRALARVNLSSLAPGQSGDAQGHGTMVAGLIASKGTYAAGAQNFPFLDVRTSDAQGQSLTSDVIAACDWILAHKSQYNIRVANFSMSGRVASSFTSDPLDKAVEKLWFNGVVVVAAAGNNGTGTGPVQIAAPANDPFVITVGALDVHSTSSVADDTVPAWSAYGHTVDGFGKPELSAPGRYLIAPVPVGSTLPLAHPDRIVDPYNGYMWMSGTSFAAPIVSAAALQVLYRHPDWTPDQVKGSLMLAARPVAAPNYSAGVGEVDFAAAAGLSSAPNADSNLDAFVITDPTTGQKVFDTAGWASAVSSAAGWSSAGWAEAGWAEAGWSTAGWATAAWSGVAWATATATAAGWASAGWAEAGWAENSSDG